MPPVKMSSMPLQHRWGVLWVLHLSTGPGLTVPITLCQLLKQRDYDCTTLWTLGGRAEKKTWRANLFFFFLLLAVLTIILPSLKTPKSFSTPSARSLRASPSSQASGAWGRCWQHCGGCLGPACPWGQAGALGAVWLLGKGYRIASKAGCRSR